ncbi:MAG: bifunctional phosphopantothenoylcysteine decarboxylase/phosphopantothenate--cysteine ligase CoaBC [Acidobacteriota bacterium]
MEVLLGVTGCIAAYKAAEVVRLLRRREVGLQVLLTRHGSWFITQGTLQTLSGRPVLTDLFQPETAQGIEHINVARRADLLLVAPATASILGKFASGIADDFLSTVYLAYQGPVLMAPAMNGAMYRHPAVQANLRTLAARGVAFVGPGEGELACGETGPGRLMDPEAIVAAALERLEVRPAAASLSGCRVLVTSGPTREPIDPVRFLSNPATGRMGHALARAARDRGAQVVLVAGPTGLPQPAGVELVPVMTSGDMEKEVLSRAGGVDLVLMAAAVGDFRVDRPSPKKIKKSGRDLSLHLVPAVDILERLGRNRQEGCGPVLVGFAADTEDLRARAWEKLRRKRVDYIVANQVGRPGSGFGAQTNEVLFLCRDGREEVWPLLSKGEVAGRILDRLVEDGGVSPGQGGVKPFPQACES